MDNQTTESKIKRDEILAEYAGEDRVVSSKEFKTALESIRLAEVKFYSNIPKLDAAIEGFEGGELIALSGPTKNGKTTFAQTLTKNFETQGIKSLWFSYEVTPRQLFSKFVSADEFFLPFKMKDKNMKWIEERIVESKLKYNTKAVFIDHLHYLLDMAQATNTSIQIGTIIRTLKLLAVEHNIVIFLLAHTTKTRSDVQPTASDIRDSSFVAQEADSTFMVWRQSEKNKKTGEFVLTGNTILTVANHRRTGAMDIKVPLLHKDNMFVQTDMKYNFKSVPQSSQAPQQAATTQTVEDSLFQV